MPRERVAGLLGLSQGLSQGVSQGLLGLLGLLGLPRQRIVVHVIIRRAHRVVNDVIYLRLPQGYQKIITGL